MAALTIRDVSRRSGLSEPTLRYYEEIGLIGPIARDESSGHRRYRTEDLDELQILACMRALGVGIEDMRVYQANRARGHTAAAEQRDLLLRHAERIEAEIAAQYARLGYLRHKAALWDARARGDAAAEAEAWQRVKEAFDRMDVHPRAHPDLGAAFLVAAGQGDAGRDADRRAAAALRYRRRARRG